MTNKSLITILLVIFLFSFASAYDSGWTQFATSSGCCINECGAVCGEEQKSCTASDYGLSFLHQTKDCTGSGWKFLVQKSAENINEHVIKTYNGAGAEKVHSESLLSGNYYLHIKGDYDPSAIDASIYVGVGDYPSTTWDSITNGKLVSDQGGYEQSCVISTPFNLESGNPNIWIKGISTGLTSNAIRSYRLTSCIEEGLKDCNSGTILTGNCGLVGGPVVDLTSPINTTYNTNLITIDASANQDIDVWNYTLNGASKGNFSPGSTTLNLLQGCYNLTVFGTNANGTGTDSSHFCIDTSGEQPIVTILHPENNRTYNTTLIQINTTSNQPIDTWLIEINGGSTNTFTPGEFKVFTKGCWNIIVYGENSNGVGQDTLDFCVNLTTINNETNRTDPVKEKKCKKSDDEKEINPYELPKIIEDIILFRNNKTTIVLGENNDVKEKKSIYPIMAGLLILGIIITSILIMLIKNKDENENKDTAFYGAVEKGIDDKEENINKEEIFY
jgi:hypothetical protein